MNQEDSTMLFSDEVLVNGFKTALSLSRDGILRWYDSGNVLHSLSVEKHVLGVSTVGQHMIVIKSFVKDDEFCFGRSCLVRKTFLFEPFSGHSLRILFHNLQSYLHSLESYPMNQEDSTMLFSDEVLVNGFKTALSLSRDGILRWYDSGNVLHSLSVEKHVLGVSTVGQHMIVIKSFVKDDEFCFGRSCLVRKTFLFEPFSGHSLRILFHNLQSYLHSL
nr:ATP-NAD kinase-like domain-containing protein [Tanacetum cinerariifolium]